MSASKTSSRETEGLDGGIERAMAEASTAPAPDPRTLARLAARLGPLELVGGFENHVYRVRPSGAEEPPHSATRILRLSHVSHRTPDEIAAELAFVGYLHSHGAPVCAPLPVEGNTLEVDGPWTAVLFEEAPGRAPEEADQGPSLFEAWGAAIGRFHRLAGSYAGPPRRAWEDDPHLDFRARLAAEPTILRRAEALLGRLRALPRDVDFGMVHGDAHAGNLRLDRGRLRFFDFDDCAERWFAQDIAVVLFYAVLQRWIPDGARERAARDFLPPFLRGYRRERPLPGKLAERLPDFLALRELVLYALLRHVAAPGCFPRKFLRGRQARLERGLPTLDLDFGALVG